MNRQYQVARYRKMADLPLLNLEESMDIDAEKLAQTVLALLSLNLHGDDAERRAWKSFPWSVMDALHEKATFQIRQRRLNPSDSPLRG